jgi:hypothetical protein
MSGKARVFMQGNGGGDVVFSGTTTVSDDKWHHLVFTFDRDVAARTYVDGVQDGGSVISQWSSVDMISPNPFRIGAYNNTDGNPMAFFTGQLDEVRVYNKALSTDEISNLYNRSVHTLRSDGKYGGAVAVEESTINRFNPKANWTLQSGMSSYWQLEKLDDYTVKVTALVDSPSVSTYNDIANGST